MAICARPPSPQDPYGKMKGDFCGRPSGNIRSSFSKIPAKLTCTDACESGLYSDVSELGHQSQKHVRLRKGETNYSLEQRIQRLQRRAEIETQIESFFLSVQKEPLHSAIEAFVPKCVSCGSVVFWQEIPSIQRLFSVRLDISLQHNDSLIGYSFMNPGIQMIPKAGDHRSYSEKIDSRFLPAKASVMLFTLMSSQNEVVGVVQVQKRFSDPELTEYDEAFARIFAVKFRTFSEWILQPTYALSDICGLMNLLELGQFLLVFQQKMRQLFRCREAEIWIIPKKKGTVRRFVTGESYVAWADRGIVGNSESRRCCNLHPGWVLSRPLWLYSPSVFASSAQYLSLRVKLFEVMDLYEHTYRVWWSLD